MIIREISKVEDAILHDAILISTLQGYEFGRVYVDEEGGCCIQFSNMDIDAIKLFLANLNPNDISLKDIDPKYYIDYEFTDNGKCLIYTPEQFKYSPRH